MFGVVVLIGGGFWLLATLGSSHLGQPQAQAVTPAQDTTTLPAPPASNVQPTNAGADTSTVPAPSNATDEAQTALIKADEATGLVQWIDGKMFYCTKGSPWIPEGQVPRPDQLRPCSQAPGAANATAPSESAETAAPSNATNAVLATADGAQAH